MFSFYLSPYVSLFISLLPLSYLLFILSKKNIKINNGQPVFLDLVELWTRIVRDLFSFSLFFRSFLYKNTLNSIHSDSLKPGQPGAYSDIMFHIFLFGGGDYFSFFPILFLYKNSLSQPLPPPPLNGRATKKRPSFFCCFPNQTRIQI